VKAFVSLVAAMFLASICSSIFLLAQFMLFSALHFQPIEISLGSVRLSIQLETIVAPLGFVVIHFYAVWRFYRIVRARLGN
jgi:hypothetical protein